MMSEVWRIDFAGISCFFLQSLIAERTIGCRVNSLHDPLRYKAHELSRDEEPCLNTYMDMQASSIKYTSLQLAQQSSLLYVNIFGIRRTFAMS